MANAPCKDCELKGCGAYHSECEKYKMYRAEVEQEHQRRWEEDLKSLAPVVPISIQSKRLKEKAKRRRRKT